MMRQRTTERPRNAWRPLKVLPAAASPLCSRSAAAATCPHFFFRLDYIDAQQQTGTCPPTATAAAPAQREGQS